MIDSRLMDILVCPICKGKLKYMKQNSELVCKVDRLAFPIENDIPLMLESKAREISQEELEEC